MSQRRIEQDEAEESNQSSGSLRGSEATFARHPLKQALRVAEAIWRDHQGEPFDLIDLAGSLNSTPQSSSFRMLLTSSFRYGLTNGSYKSPKISLTPLGSSIVAPQMGTNPSASLREALLRPELNGKLLPRLDRKLIPREEVLKNTLMKEYGISRNDVDAAYKVLMQNISDYNLSQDLKGSTYFQLDRLSAPATQSPFLQTGEEVQQIEPEGQETLEQTVAKPEEVKAQIPKQIFVAHGKNKRPLEQLEKILNRFKVPYKVAEEEANRGRPVGKKVAELMEQCTSGIFIFTADEEAVDGQGKTVFRPSDNVVYELGAASVLYGEKIVILKENDVSFASDFVDLAYISFERDKLDAKAADLMVEFIGLGFLELRPT